MRKALERFKNFALANPGLVLGLALVGVGQLLGVALAQDPGQAVGQSVTDQLAAIVCPVAEILRGPVVRFVSLGIFIGAVVYYLGNDSRTAKGLAVAAVVAIILANTFPTWQQIFTGKSYQDLQCNQLSL